MTIAPVGNILQIAPPPSPWEGLSAVSFGILLHLFSASIFSQKVFRGSKLTRVFLQPFCNLRLWQSHGSVAGRLRPTGAWGRWPAGIFSICVRMARIPRPAQPVDSPGRLSIARWIGHEVAGLPASGSCARQSCAHFLAMHQCRSTLAHLQSFIAGQRMTTADDVSGPLVRAFVVADS